MRCRTPRCGARAARSAYFSGALLGGYLLELDPDPLEELPDAAGFESPDFELDEPESDFESDLVSLFPESEDDSFPDSFEPERLAPLEPDRLSVL
jgi:hypothetical protein